VLTHVLSWCQDVALNTPLVVSVMAGHLRTVELLISRDANVNSKNKNGESCL
jgi:ankyrin repeat protein